DASQQCGFYVARNATGHDRLLSFTGNIACVRLAGKAEGYYLWPSGDNAAAKTKHEKVTQMGTMDISVFDATKQHSAPVFTTQSNADGSFAIYLQPNGTFNVVFGCPGAFSRTLVLETPHDNLDDLIVDRHENVRLDCLRTNHEYAFPREAFFAHPVATELSKEGKIIVQQTAQFLFDNPTLRLYVTCIYTERDTAFNQLLCFAREDAIEQLLWRHGAPARVLNNAVFETVFQPNGENDQTNAVLLFFETPAEKRSPTTNGRMLRRSLNDFLDTQETANSNRQNNDADTRQTTTNNASTGTTPTSNGLNTDEEPSKPSEAFQKMMETGVFETQQ
ncbi:MAG: hypothetical protein SPJ13_03665, partial [Bacteroidales bacterium]|nr:hypothetical protein [Bacteroidales bacterium]